MVFQGRGWDETRQPSSRLAAKPDSSEHVGPEHVVSESLSVAICVTQSLRQKADSSHEGEKNKNFVWSGWKHSADRISIRAFVPKKKKEKNIFFSFLPLEV